MILTTENIIAIVAAAVSFGSMCAAIASAATARKNARIAEQAKEQARRAATLERRAKAIDHLRKALVDIEDTQVIKGETVNNVREAMRLSELVSDGEIQAALAKAHHETQRLHHLTMPPNERRDQDLQDMHALGKDLKGWMDRMKHVATLGH
jgi:hypothetical protein